MVVHTHIDSNPCTREMGRGETFSSGPEFPPGFEDFIDVVGPSSHNHKREMPLEIFEGDKSLFGKRGMILTKELRNYTGPSQVQ